MEDGFGEKMVNTRVLMHTYFMYLSLCQRFSLVRPQCTCNVSLPLHHDLYRIVGKRRFKLRRFSTVSCDMIVTRPDSVVQKVDNAIHWINLYPVHDTIGFPIHRIGIYPLNTAVQRLKKCGQVKLILLAQRSLA